MFYSCLPELLWSRLHSWHWCDARWLGSTSSLSGQWALWKVENNSASLEGLESILKRKISKNQFTAKINLCLKSIDSKNQFTAKINLQQNQFTAKINLQQKSIYSSTYFRTADSGIVFESVFETNSQCCAQFTAENAFFCTVQCE